MKNIYVMKEGGDAAKKKKICGAKWEIKESTTNILVITVTVNITAVVVVGSN